MIGQQDAFQPCPSCGAGYIEPQPDGDTCSECGQVFVPESLVR